MRNKILILSFLVGFALVSNKAFAQDASSSAVSCFDYYRFGSVQVPIESEISKAVSGTDMAFQGSIINNNSYPVVGGTVVVKIFRKQAGLNANGPDVVDQFIAKDNISIAANAKQKINFVWKIPAYAKSGDYQAVTYFTSDHKFNLLGLTFTDDVIGNTYNFSVSGEQKGVVGFDKNTVKVNGNPYSFASFLQHFDATSSVAVKASLVNGTGSAQSVSVVWKIYWWDAQQNSHLLDTKNESLTLNGGETKDLTYSVTDKNYPVYYVVGEVDYKDTKSIIGVRFVRDGIDSPRINYPAVTSYPLKKGESATVFSCLHNTSENDVLGSLVLKLKDSEGNIFREYKYSGNITGDMMGVKDNFTPDKNYENFSILAELYQGDKLIDNAEMKYDCNAIDPTACPVAGSPQVLGNEIIQKIINYGIPIGAVLIILLLILFIIRKKNMKNSMMVLLALVLCGGLFLGASKVEAKSVVWSETESGSFQGYNNWYEGGLRWNHIFDNPSISVNYDVQVKDAQTGASLSDGSTVLPGTKLKFIFTPRSMQDIYWFGTGYDSDTPYGHWVNGAGPIVSNGTHTYGFPGSACYSNGDSDGSQTGGDFTKYSSGVYAYVALNVAPPVQTLTNTNGLTCGTPASDGSVDCTVNNVSGGTAINPTFNFSNTTGKFYYSVTLHSRYACEFTDTPVRLSTGSTFVLNVPTQTVSYSLNVSSNASSNPTVNQISVSGISNVCANVNSPISVSVNDPDGKNIRYGVDWNNDGSVDQWLPSSGYVGSGISQVGTKLWTTAGSKTIGILTKNIDGVTSEMSTFTFDVKSEANCNITPPTSVIDTTTQNPDGSKIGAVSIKNFVISPNTINPYSAINPNTTGKCNFSWTLNQYDSSSTCSVFGGNLSSFSFIPNSLSGTSSDTQITRETTYRLTCGEQSSTGITGTSTKYATCYINSSYNEVNP